MPITKPAGLIHTNVLYEVLAHVEREHASDPKVTDEHAAEAIARRTLAAIAAEADLGDVYKSLAALSLPDGTQLMIDRMKTVRQLRGAEEGHTLQ